MADENKDLTCLKRGLDLARVEDESPPESTSERLDEINKACKEGFISSRDARDREQYFRQYLATHVVLAADEGASEEALVRAFLLSKPGLMTLLNDPKTLNRVYAAFDHHLSMHEAQHLLLSPEGFLAQLKRIAQKANKVLVKFTGKPSYFEKGQGER